MSSALLGIPAGDWTLDGLTILVAAPEAEVERLMASAVSQGLARVTATGWRVLCPVELELPGYGSAG